jgi:hypothetical protein
VARKVSSHQPQPPRERTPNLGAIDSYVRHVNGRAYHPFGTARLSWQLQSVTPSLADFARIADSALEDCQVGVSHTAPRSAILVCSVSGNGGL